MALSGQVRHVQAELVEGQPMLRLQRQARQPQLPAKFGGSRYDEHDVTNGRFVPQRDEGVPDEAGVLPEPEVSEHDEQDDDDADDGEQAHAVFLPTASTLGAVTPPG